MSGETISAHSLGIDLKSGDERELFKWFLASFLFGKRVRPPVAARAYHTLVDKHRLDLPSKICKRSNQDLLNLLGEGPYVESEASKAELLQLCRKLNEEYGGKLGRLKDASGSQTELKRRLQEFGGVGPKTVQLFLSEARHVWS